MTYFEEYISLVDLATPGLGQAIKNDIDQFSKKHLENFSFNERIQGLLHGQVQSGKTAQALGIISCAADLGFKLFIYLTTDNVNLQKQTLDRAQNSLSGILVCDENQTAEFLQNPKSKPVVLVLKKNQYVLSNWLNRLTGTTIARQRPIMIIDDEGDAASLNTKINQKKQSRINDLLNSIFFLAPSGIYLQVTATPNALLLQDNRANNYFAYAFAPGKNYLGGNDFYGENSKSVRIIDDLDGDRLLSSPTIPDNLRKALLDFIITSIQLDKEGKNVCNMLIHPSHKIKDHEKVRQKIYELISSLKTDYLKNSQTLKDLLKYEWEDLKSTYPSISDFSECWEEFGHKLANLHLLVLNSNTEFTSNYNNGTNILIGGNVLGRGLTIDTLQVVYYTRRSKEPLADTVWQHQRIFGYDRVIGLSRIYLTTQLVKIFRDLNETNRVLFDSIKSGDYLKIPIILPEKTKPTRLNVLDKEKIDVIPGGVNFFPFDPSDLNTNLIDKMVGTDSRESITTIQEIKEILKIQVANDYSDWDKDAFLGALEGLHTNDPSTKCLLIIRTGRSITKGTGTLLSPNDRELGELNNDKVVLTMYRLAGEKEKGWNGSPIWIPNIKFPKGRMFWRTIE